MSVNAMFLDTDTPYSDADDEVYVPQYDERNWDWDNDDSEDDE